jgi:hypothetical protein
MAVFVMLHFSALAYKPNPCPPSNPPFSTPPPKKNSANETWASLLFFITAQSDAAAQATAIALGNMHSAALLVPEDGPDANHNLYTFGFGHNGELGHGAFDDAYDEPEPLCLGYEQCQVWWIHVPVCVWIHVALT